MRYPCRLALALLGCATMFNADARLQVSPHIPLQIPLQTPLHALHLPSLTVTLAPPEAADYAAMLDASAWRYADGEPWRQPQGGAQPFDYLAVPQIYSVPTPIPEPGHYHLLLIGMGLLCLYGGRPGTPAPWRLIRVGKKQHAPVMML